MLHMGDIGRSVAALLVGLRRQRGHVICKVTVQPRRDDDVERRKEGPHTNDMGGVQLRLAGRPSEGLQSPLHQHMSGTSGTGTWTLGLLGLFHRFPLVSVGSVVVPVVDVIVIVLHVVEVDVPVAAHVIAERLSGPE